MNGVLYLAVVVAAFGCGFAQPQPDPCRTCQLIVNIAQHHFNNNVTDKGALLTQLQGECQRLTQFEGAAAAAECTRVVNANIDTIFNDMSTNKSSMQTCQDIKECPAPSASVPKRQKKSHRRQKRQSHDPCQTCEIIIAIAKRHFNNNITDMNALKTQLDMECQQLTQHGFTQQEATNCQNLVDTNINAIFTELKNNPAASPLKICQDFGECKTMIKREKRQMPHDPCRTCQIIVAVARHYFNNSITDKNALQQQLLAECVRLAQFEGQQASAACTQIVNNNMDKIYADMSTNASSLQTCQDIKECPPSPTGSVSKHQKRQRQKRQRPHDPCRTCEVIVNIARYHFHNNVTDKNALLQTLLGECQRLAQFEGQQASQHCTQIVNANIDTIFADMSTNKSPQQTCTDIKECPSSQVVKRQKRQQPHDQCRTCQIIINIARYHFHNNVTDKGALQAELLHECQGLAQHEGQQAADACTKIVNANIDKIFGDMSTNKSPLQTCQDIREC